MQKELDVVAKFPERLKQDISHWAKTLDVPACVEAALINRVNEEKERRLQERNETTLRRGRAKCVAAELAKKYGITLNRL